MEVLIVDLDDTLLKTDLLFESVFKLLCQSPKQIFKVPYWFLQGKAVLKSRLAELVSIDPKSLPYRQPLLDYLKLEHERGTTLILASASAQHLVKQIADYLGIFEHAIGSIDINLKGSEKTAAVKKLIGDRPFRYAGDSRVDLPIWKKSIGAIAVNPSRFVSQQLQSSNIPTQTIRDSVNKFRALIRLFRFHHWSKNCLLFLPLIAGHYFNAFDKWAYCLLAFLSFGFIASAVYLLNDMVDLESDRIHATKKNRPLASGEISLVVGLVAATVSLCVSFLIATFLPLNFRLMLLVYLGLNLAYSMRLKKLLILDVVLLASLYTLRIISGGLAVGVPVSEWLLAFSSFFFFGLAMVKRCTEIKKIKAHVPGRGYLASDFNAVFTLGAGTSLISVLIIVLYLNSQTAEHLYHYSERLWVVVPLLLYWVSRVWILVSRGEIHEDPVIFALKDRATLCVIFLLAVVIGLSI